MALSEQTCIPCQGGIAPLSEAEAAEKLPEIPGWELQEKATFLKKRFEFSNFKKSLAFVNQVGDIAEAEGHHPDILFGWGYAEIRIQTHKIHGLHENDFILAAKINDITAC